ncbi:MAG TPA: peptidase inhibitor family I36 protein [Pseudonocardiaceae bacterium]|nr:peptidase inhibitor family I36 protein [Pseudonocardiaceae bacterium]
MTGFIRVPIPRGRRRLVAGVIAALAAVTVMVAPAAVANAATAPSQPSAVQPLSSPTDCSNMVTSAGRPLCFWVDANFVGKMGVVFGTNDSWTGAAFAQPACGGGTWNDCASALYNAGSEIAIVFKNIDRKATDEFQCIAPGTMSFKDLALNSWPQPAHGTMNDAISSNEWTPSGAQCP